MWRQEQAQKLRGLIEAKNAERGRIEAKIGELERQIEEDAAGRKNLETDAEKAKKERIEQYKKARTQYERNIIVWLNQLEEQRKVSAERVDAEWKKRMGKLSC